MPRVGERESRRCGLYVQNVNVRFFPSPSLGLSLLGIAIIGLVKVILVCVSYLFVPV